MPTRKYTTMSNIYSTVILTIYICLNFYTLSATDSSYCLNFTWVGAKPINNNCTKVPTNIPCVEPIERGMKPDLVEIWHKATENGTKDPRESDYVCTLQSGYVCVKYTYIFNKAVENVTYFCGKVIADQIKPITSGCYAQYIDGYTIEACACESKGTGIPCNSTTRYTYSIVITVLATTVLMFVYKIFRIP